MEISMVAQDVQQTSLIHHRIAVRIGGPRNWYVRQLTIREQSLCSSEQRYDQPQARKSSECAGRHRGDGCYLDVLRIPGIGPDAQIELRHFGGEKPSPLMWLAEKRVEQNCHFAVAACGPRIGYVAAGFFAPFCCFAGAGAGGGAGARSIDTSRPPAKRYTPAHGPLTNVIRTERSPRSFTPKSTFS